MHNQPKNAFQLIFSNPTSLLFIVIGVTAGIVVGCLPGLTATMGCALLIPFTYSLPPVEGLLLLMGIFTGGIYGGSISGILIRTPGTPAAAATLLDGYPLTQKGEGGKAIGISTVASFVGGTIGALIMAFFSSTPTKGKSSSNQLQTWINGICNCFRYFLYSSPTFRGNE